MLHFLLFLFGCSPKINNPSGDCEAESDGSRLCYHSPEASDSYLPDCQNPLKRELWRVFALNESSAYIIPRPDTMGLQFDLCESGEYTELLQEYDLCADITDPDTINNIPIEKALQITNILHQHLVFSTDSSGQVTPWAPDEDMLLACQQIDDPIVDEYCGNISSQNESGECLELAFTYPEEAGLLFATTLNTLYGIE